MNYLKFGCGLIVGISSFWTPLSSMLRTPPGSRRPFNRSSTDGLQKHNEFRVNIEKSKPRRLQNIIYISFSKMSE